MSDEEEITLHDIINSKHFYIGLIILFAAIPRVLMINVNQAVWWDEAQYLLMTKSFFTGAPTTGWWEGRGVVYPLILYLLSFLIGFNEFWIRILNVIFSLGIVYATYLLVKEMYGKRYGLIAALITSAQWVLFFYAFRVMLEVPSTLLMTLSAYYFIKSINKKGKHNLLSGVLLGVAFGVRFTSGVAILAYLAYLLIMKNYKIKNYYWIIGFIIGYSLLGFYDLAVYGNPMHSAIKFLEFNLQSSGGAQQGDQFYYLTTLFFNYKVVMSVLLGLGFIGLILKSNKKNNLFTLLNVLIFFLFYSLLTQVKEFRFVIHLLPFMSLISVLGINLVYNLFTKNKKFLTIFMLGVASLIVIENLTWGVDAVQASASSYDNVRYAGEFLSNYGDNILTNSMPQINYYSGKDVYSFPVNESDIKQLVIDKNITHAVVSIYEQHPDYAYALSGAFTPIRAYPTPQEPYLIIYEINRTILLQE